MPIYEYACGKCKAEFELYQPIMASPRVCCPKPFCRGRVRRILTGRTNIVCAKDQLYSFQHIHLPGAPRFESKRQWKAYLKANGLTDSVTVADLKRGAGRTPRPQHDVKALARRKAEEKWRSDHQLVLAR